MTLSPYFTLLTSGARASAATETFDVPTRGRTGLILVSDVTADGGAFSQTITILGVDPASGKTWPILAGAAQASVSTQVLQVAPGVVAVTDLVANVLLPATVRVQITHTDATTITRTVALQLVG